MFPYNIRVIARQQSFDDLGTSLREVTFCVIDIETTGGSPASSEITEVAAARFEGGRCTGTFQTLVNPGVAIPPEIVYLTGITEAMVGPAPVIGAVLPSLLEFVRDAIIVGHNIRFDLAFLNTALQRHAYERFANRSVDTCRLARRLVREEVPNCKLGTLARHYALRHQPTHRALDDVRATADLLHLLLERAAGFGVLGLDDLIELPALNRHPHADKLHLTNRLPRRPGVYLFRDRSGAVLYIGKATNLRARVRSYFSTDDRRKVLPLLAVTHRIDFVECATPIQAAVLEIRLIQRELPRFNRQAKFWTNYAYIRIDEGRGVHTEPAMVATRELNAKLAQFVGPFPSLGAARLGAAALKEAAAVAGPGWLQLLRQFPDELLAPLHERMGALADAERFEEAAALRDRAGVLSRGIERQRRATALRCAGWTEISVDDTVLRLDHGRLRFSDSRTPAPPEPNSPIPRDVVDELACVISWLSRVGPGVRVESSEGGIAWPVRRMPRFQPVARAGGVARPAHQTPVVVRSRSSVETRTSASRANAARPSSIERSARVMPSRRSAAMPAAKSAPDAFNTTMSR